MADFQNDFLTAGILAEENDIDGQPAPHLFRQFKLPAINTTTHQRWIAVDPVLGGRGKLAPYRRALRLWQRRYVHLSV
ncbi:MAG: hypothetical protein U5O39_01095 [Gammaproteobacteria bacterium]|nr:hypothetical protein [Gammaproteobacteria bacterium]